MSTADKKGLSRFQGLGRLLDYGKPYRKGFISAFILLAIATAFEMASPWVMKIILDDYIGKGNHDLVMLAWLGFALTMTYVGSAVFQYFQSIIFNDNALEVIHDIRQQVFTHLLKLPMRYFDSEPTGRLVSRLTNDSEVLRQMFVGVLPAILRGVLKLVGIFIALALLDVSLMLLMMVIVPVLLWSMHLYQKLSHPVVHGVRARLADINTALNESLLGMRIIQATNHEQRLCNTFAEKNKEWSDLRRKEINVNSLLLMPFGHLVQTAALAGIVAWFGWKSGYTTVEAGTIYAFINYLARFFEPFRQIAMQLGSLQQSLVASERVFAVLDEKPEVRDSTKEQADNSCPGRLEFRNVTLSYDGQHKALDDVSFSVNPGQFTAIVGHSGSGKSSIINLLMRFYPHQQGEILVDNAALQEMGETELRQSMGLVFQEPFIFTGTLHENISLENPSISQDHSREAAEKVHASRFINRLPEQYDHIPGSTGQSLSTGERQLLSFARTVAQNPRILLLDEATANIDGETEQYIKDALITLREGRTTIAIAHRLSTIQDADQILVMDKGKITQRGTHEELLMQGGHYRDLYLSQQAEEQLQADIGGHAHDSTETKAEPKTEAVA
ncbi:ABC transporter ATP-binding protein [Parendozoicomonas haliclonae]|uniref:Putative multidrug resistance ABC transporter ATP-binding/permease protein YheH n=1 Tax=Parendozoicomonas haliclonae TaxID=1960125 RepID=A0A1X7AIH0_9GAMM|nr:ABC transporter ATP-binding protein [Parendozoicomonas haliclonae]SMA43960.1 putative multidrug resistance ABC transporter ATP-binding/permease protein YheH [Parendozoicomonas haliclonae]